MSRTKPVDEANSPSVPSAALLQPPVPGGIAKVGFKLDIRMRQAQGAISRFLKEATGRGFALSRMAARPTEDGVYWDLTLLFTGERSGSELARQVRRLDGVEWARLGRPGRRSA